MARKPPPVRKRPQPPASLWADEFTQFVPAPEVLAWIVAEILEDSGSIHNPDHEHLLQADLRVLWASSATKQRGKTVIGTAEEVTFRAGGWQKSRQERQFIDWFGGIPQYLITLDGRYCADCSDAEFCALVEHELYHIAHLKGPFGPLFTQDGRPKTAIVGHDVEEFVGVVRRYGVGDPNGALARLAAAAREAPEVDRVRIGGACGACLLKVA